MGVQSVTSICRPTAGAVVDKDDQGHGGGCGIGEIAVWYCIGKVTRLVAALGVEAVQAVCRPLRHGCLPVRAAFAGRGQGGIRPDGGNGGGEGGAGISHIDRPHLDAGGAGRLLADRAEPSAREATSWAFRALS